MCGGVEQVLTKSIISVEVCRPRNLKEERFTFYDGIDMITPWCAVCYLSSLFCSAPPNQVLIDGGDIKSLVLGVPTNITCRADGGKPAPEMLW